MDATQKFFATYGRFFQSTTNVRHFVQVLKDVYKYSTLHDFLRADPTHVHNVVEQFAVRNIGI